MKLLICCLMMLCLCLACRQREQKSWNDFRAYLASDSINQINIRKYETYWDVEVLANQKEPKDYQVEFQTAGQANKAYYDLRHFGFAYSMAPGQSTSGLLFNLTFLFVLLLWPLLIAVAIYQLMVRNRLIDQVDKLIWAATILVLPYLGPLLYLLFGRRSPAVRS